MLGITWGTYYIGYLPLTKDWKQGLLKLGLRYSDGTSLERTVGFSLEPKQAYAEVSGWQLYEDRERKRYIKYAFVEDTTDRIQKGKIPREFKYFAK